MSTFAILCWVVGGFVLLYYGADWLVRGSVSLGLRWGLTPLVVGLTLVSYGTSMPELAVSVKASWDGQGGIALGNVVGSNICNIGLILGMAAVVTPLRVRLGLLRFDTPLLIGVSLLLPLLLWNEQIGRWEGLLLFLGIVLYTVFTLRRVQDEHDPEVLAEYEELAPGVTTSWGGDVARVVGGIMVLALGGRFLVDGSVALARQVGMSEAVIGLTLVALGTSLPELAATLVAAFRREADIAVGNVIGSNLFNLLNVLGISAMVQPVDQEGVTRVDLGVMVGMTLLLVPLMRTGFVLQRWEGGLFLLAYAAYILYLWAR
jgi:cation:H+ antiporter